MSADLPRPQKVTMACLIAGLSAALMLIYIFATLSNWGSIELQEQVRNALEKELLSEADLDVAEVLGWLRILLMAGAALAVSTIVFAIYTARGHRGARVALTILAAGSSFVFVAFGLAGLLPAAMAALCVFYLWSAEARAWFRGEVPLPHPGGLSTALGTAPPAQPSPGYAPDQPRPSDRPFATPPGTPARASPTGKPPRAISIAVIVTSVMAGLVGLVCGLNSFLYLISPAEYRDLLLENPLLTDSGLLEQTGMSAAELARLMFISTAIGFVLAIAAISAALLMLRRAPAARVVLTVLAALTIGISLAAFPPGLIWAGGTVYVLVLLYRADVNRWFRARK